MLLALYKKKSKSKKTNKARDISAANAFELNLRVFTHKELAEATGNFVEELGRGAYGIVYKGVLKVVGDSQVTVAVKKLDRVVQEGEKEFRNEVKAIGQTYHKNLVRLHWLLQRRAESFDCLQLLTSNSPISSKVDVYCYGVILLLEIVCCKKSVDLEDNVILIDWAYDCFRNRRLGDLIEDDLEAMEDMEMVERYVKIGIWCIQEEPGMRPNMRSLTQMLEGVAQVHDPPNPSPYSIFSCEEYLSCGQVSSV
ncbi:unnamed protein product [Brassica oleracea var. botrytis]